jgi:HD-GYP domain-containing protein (c-di-GMP phosphodiesterase class II)
MRLLKIDEIKEGMEVGETIYNESGHVLLKQGVILRPNLVQNVKKLRISAIYIADDFSKDIEVTPTIDSQLRNETVMKIKNLFCNSNSSDPKSITKDLDSINDLLKNMIDQIVSNRNSMVNLVDLKTHDNYTFQHSVNVTVLSSVIGVELGYNPKALLNLSKGAMFHDVGKMLVPLEILNKPGKYTPEEFDIMKNHPNLGYEFAKKNLNLTGDALIALIHHHEKYDGTGYPHQKSAKQIHRNAQIVAICDVFDAITSKRVYHEPILPSDAIEYIMGNSGKHFDPEVVDIFLKKVAAYPIGVKVHLSNGKSGLVCENFEGRTLRPKIKIFSDNKDANVYLDLGDKENMSVTITKIEI